MAESVEGLIYAEAQRGLALQPVLLNELRARTGILLAVVTATTSFLGGIVVKNGGLGCWGVAALVAFGVSITCCLAVLSPHRKWKFAEGAADLLTNYRHQEHPDGAAWTLPQVQRDLALHIEEHTDAAVGKMKWLQVLFLAAGFSLAVEITCWLMEFAN